MEDACTWFWIGPLNVLGGPTEYGAATPPVLLAYYGIAALKRVWEVGDAALGIGDPYEVLDLRRDEVCVLIQGGMLFDPVRVPYELLRAAWRGYHDRVRELMRRYDPDLITLKTIGEYNTGKLSEFYDHQDARDWSAWRRWLNGEDPLREQADHGLGRIERRLRQGIELVNLC